MARGRAFWAYSGQFRGLFKEFTAKTGGRAPPSGSAPGSWRNTLISISRSLASNPIVLE